MVRTSVTRIVRVCSLLGLVLALVAVNADARACAAGEVECPELPGQCWQAGATCCGKRTPCGAGSECVPDITIPEGGRCLAPCPTGTYRCGHTHCVADGNICCANVGHEEVSCEVTHLCESDGTCSHVLNLAGPPDTCGAGGGFAWAALLAALGLLVRRAAGSGRRDPAA